MIPIADNLNVIEPRANIQGITDGIAIDLDALKLNLVMVKQTPQQALNMWLQKGSYLYRSSQINGEFNNAQNLPGDSNRR
jgi:hypothetical protein